MYEFIKKLEKSFESTLPSTKAHTPMMPETPIPGSGINKNTSGASKSSVLILFYPKKNDVYTIFIERQLYNGVHSGQTSFPGGKAEKTDNNLTDTALREANEEIGINISEITITGELSKVYIAPSNCIVTPFVGVCKDEPLFNPNAREVNKIIEVPFSEILNKINISKSNVKVADGNLHEVPCFIFNNNIVWGATAMILNELIALWNS